VDVHDGVGKGIDQDRGYDPHEAGQDHEVHLVFPEGLQQGGVVGGAAGEETVIQVNVRDAVAFCPFQGEGLGTVADDAGDPGRDRSLLDGIDDRLQVGAASRNQDADLQQVSHDVPGSDEFHAFAASLALRHLADDAGLLVEPERRMRISSVSFSGTTRTMPIPQLKVRKSSLSSMFPPS